MLVRGGDIVSFGRYATQFFKAFVAIYTPNSSTFNFQLLHILTSTWDCQFLYF